MKHYLFLLALPSLALAQERATISGGSFTQGNGRSLALPICHPDQALTVTNGALACANVRPNVVIIGSCTTALVSANVFRSEVLCPEGYSLLGCHGGSLSGASTNGVQRVEPFTQNDRMGCRSTAHSSSSPAINPVYAQCMGAPGLTARHEIIPATGCYTPAAYPVDPGLPAWSDGGA